MTTMVFKHPPLVEIVAEVRWDLPNQPQIPPQLSQMPFPVSGAGSHELHFLNFAGKAGAKGFGFVERIIPPSFPLMAHQVAVRFRNQAGSTGAPVFQLGPGIFTANISPPYKSWKSVLPFIETGLELLIESRSDEDKEKPFSRVVLRYIDAFGDELIQGKSIANFMSQDLGIKIELPPSIMKFSPNPSALKQSISASLPLENGTLELQVLEAWVRNVRSLVMHTTVVCEGPVSPQKAPILASLNAAHNVIHESFVGMTTSLHKIMEPEELA